MDLQHRPQRLQLTFTKRMWGPVVLLVLILATAWASGGKYLLIRQLWMDEVHSWLIVTDANESHGMDALADGVDFNPPTWFLVTRWLTSGAESASELRLRLLSMVWMLLALSGLCLQLSRHFSPGVCIAAVLLTASHPLLIHQSTEIRFYGFWCACAVWLCCVIQWRPRTTGMRCLQVIAVSILAVLTTTCHYFGILSVCLVVLPLIIRRIRDRAGFRLAVIAVLCSSAGLTGCCHFLVGQRAALSRPTWISPTTPEDTVLFLQALFPAWQILLCMGGMAVSLLLAKRSAANSFNEKSFPGFVCLLPCMCLAGMPLMIVLVAWCLQPALVTRYAIVGITGFAPVFACALARCSPSVQKSLTMLSLLGLGYNVSHCANQWIRDDLERSMVVQRVLQCPADTLIIFEDRIQWMPVLHHHPELASRCRLAEFADDELLEDNALRIVQRDVGRRIQKWYPQYSMLPVRTLAQRWEFIVIPYVGGSCAELLYPPGYVKTECPAGFFRFRLAEKVVIEGDSTRVSPQRNSFDMSATGESGEKVSEYF